MKWIDFNINEYVRVKLTEHGEEKYRDYYAGFGITKTELKKDEEGYVKFQMWNLMSIFGDSIWLGSNKLPFDTNIKIQNNEQ